MACLTLSSQSPVRKAMQVISRATPRTRLVSRSKNVNVRSKGGASLHSWGFEISVKCADKDRPLTPLTHNVAADLAVNVFTNVSTVEIAEPAEPNYRGVSVQRCN
jgi:hypothetical protein